MILDNDVKIEVAAEASKVVMKSIIATKTVSELKSYLQSIQLVELMPEIADFVPHGDIYILGDLSIQERIIYHIFKDLNIDIDRVKIVAGYEEFKTYNFNRFQYNSSIRLIFVGPLPHSTREKGDYSSIIAKMEQEEGFPKVVRLGTEGSLKVTKTNLKEAVMKEIQTGYLDIN